jgi:hypothetical protein
MDPDQLHSLIFHRSCGFFLYRALFRRVGVSLSLQQTAEGAEQVELGCIPLREVDEK